MRYLEQQQLCDVATAAAVATAPDRRWLCERLFLAVWCGWKSPVLLQIAMLCWVSPFTNLPPMKLLSPVKHFVSFASLFGLLGIRESLLQLLKTGVPIFPKEMHQTPIVSRKRLLTQKKAQLLS
jgi:hypothetical protein